MTPEHPRQQREARTPDCEVLIVGAGPTGLVLACLLACLLAQSGVEVAVVERRGRPRLYSCAIGLHPPALAVLHRLGLEDAALAEGLRVHSGTARSRGRDLGSLTFERAWPDRPFVLTLPQNRTEALLSQRLQQLAPGALHRGWEVTEVSEDEDGVTASACGTSDATATGGHAGAAPPKLMRRRVVPEAVGDAATSRSTATSRTWRARTIVGADGPRSVVRATAGISVRHRHLPDTYLMGDFPDACEVAGARDSAGSRDAAESPRTAGSHDAERRVAVVHLEPGGVVEAFPLPGGLRRWVAHTGRTRAEESPAFLARIVGKRTGMHLDPDAATMISAFTVRRRIATRMVQGRSIIVGDAAHEVSPIGGQGMTLGWLDADRLAPLLVRVLTEDAGTGPDSLHRREEFRAFERGRLRGALAAARQAELSMVLGRPAGTALAAIRDVALRSVLATPARHTLARAFTMYQPLTGRVPPAGDAPMGARPSGEASEA